MRVRRVVGLLAGIPLAAGLAVWVLEGFRPGLPTSLLPGLAWVTDPRQPWAMLVIAALAVAVACSARPSRHDEPDVAAPIRLVALAGATAVLALSSYWNCSGDQAPVWSPIAWTVALFVGDVHDPFDGSGSCPATPPVGLQAARLGALVVVALLAHRAYLTLFAVQVDRGRARRARSVVVVGGAGPGTERLLRAVRRDLPPHRRLVVVGRDPAARAAARAAGALHVPVDLRDADDLAAVVGGNLGRRLRGVHLLYADAAANCRLAEDLLSATAERDGRTAGDAPRRLVVRIDDPWQAEDWKRRHLGQADSWLCDAVSVEAVAAQAAVDRVLASSPHTVVCAGRSAFTLAFLHEMAMRRRSLSARLVPVTDPLPITYVVGSQARPILREHRELEQRLGDPGAPTLVFARPGTFADLSATLMGDGDGTSLVLGGEGGPTGLAGASATAARHPGWTIVAWDPDGDARTDRPVMARLFLVGRTFDHVDRLPDLWAWIGEAVHQRYLDARFGGDPIPGHPSRGAWDDLSAAVKESNLRHVAHLFAYVREAGWEWSTVLDDGVVSRPADVLSGDRLIAAARSEHESWLRHREQRGIARRAAGRAMRSAAPPWDDLDVADREYTVAGVRSTLDLLGSLGFRLVPAHAGAGRTATAGAVWGTYERRGEVRAEQLAAASDWQTQRGETLRADAGDWMVMTPDGSRHSVAAPIFTRTYRHVTDDRWERSGQVRARRLTQGQAVMTLEGLVTAEPGDWVVVGVEGEQWAMGDADFRARYVPVREVG